MKIYAYHLKAYYEFSTLFAPAGTNIAAGRLVPAFGGNIAWEHHEFSL